MINKKWLLAPLLIACERGPQAQKQQPTVGEQAATTSDSVIHNGVSYRARAELQPTNLSPELKN